MTKILSITPARRKLAATKDNELYVQISLQTPPATQQAKRPALDISVALDTSGSMSDVTSVRKSASEQHPRYSYGYSSVYSKIEIAKLTVEKLIDHLSDRDTLSLVTFETYGRPHFSNLLMDARGKEKAREALSRLNAGGNTNLSEGLSLACQNLSRGTESLRRVMIFTDGQANVGLTSPTEIERQIFSRYTNIEFGVTTFGFGESYNAELLNSLTRGGGTHYFINDAEKISVSFGTELGALVSLYGRNTKLTLIPPTGVEIEEILNPLPVERQGRNVIVNVGDILGDTRFDVVAKLKLAKRSKATKTIQTLLSVTGMLDDVASGGALGFSESVTVELGTVKSADKTDDAGVLSAAAVQIAAKAQKEAAAKADRGDLAGARKLLSCASVETQSLGRHDLAAVTSDSLSVGYSSMDKYKSLGSKMSASLGSTLTRQRASMGGAQVAGVDVDALFANAAQKKFANSFAITADRLNDDMPDLASMVTTK